MSPVRSRLTRILHLAILLIVAHQLVNSLVMERPLPGEEPEWPFVLHVRIGTVGLAVLLLFWLWTLVRDRSETSWSDLFPWFSPGRLRRLAAEINKATRELRAFRAPSLEMGAIASAVHGLGLALASFMAASGALWFYVLDGSSYGRTSLAVHELAGNFMWAYLIGHAAMAVLHQALGDDVFSRMFWRRPGVRREPVSAE